MVAKMIENEWKTLNEDEFEEFIEDEWLPIFSASRLKAIYLIIHALGEKGLLCMDEFC